MIVSCCMLYCNTSYFNSGAFFVVFATACNTCNSVSSFSKAVIRSYYYIPYYQAPSNMKNTCIYILNSVWTDHVTQYRHFPNMLGQTIFALNKTITCQLDVLLFYLLFQLSSMHHFGFNARVPRYSGPSDLWDERLSTTSASNIRLQRQSSWETH